jgi:Cof subfamily protein (haloacid dehalogenase superfamily)
MAYRLVAIDLDDTFLNTRHEFSERIKKAVARTVQKGVSIVIATGRTYRGSLQYIQSLNLKTPSITCGGAIVVDRHGKMIYESQVPHGLAKKILEYAESLGVHAQVYLDDNYVYAKHSDYAKIYEGFYGFPGVEAPDLLQFPDLTTPKVLFISEPEKISQIKIEAQKLFPEVMVAVSKPFYLEFNNPKASKGSALEYLANQMGIPREDIIAIGDSEIDASMIEYAGLGVAVENAIPSVKEKAGFITYSNDDDGVAYVLEKFVLEDEV